MKDALVRILNKYTSNKTKIVTGNSLAKFLRHGAPEAISQAAHLAPQYLVQGSAGKGNWADIPWIGIFDRDITTSAQKGYYIVYLFEVNMAGVYLSLNQGWTQYKNIYKYSPEARQEIKSRAQIYQSVLEFSTQDFPDSSMILHAKGDLGKGYELGHICGKYYSKNALPSTEKLVEDLNKLISVYANLKRMLSGKPITSTVLIAKEPREDKTDKERIDQIEERKASKLDIEELKRRALQATTKPAQKVTTPYYPRDPYVTSYTKKRANGKCELCGNDAPFITRDGDPFLECHHLIERAEGGPDTMDNTVALCPNCHRKIHNLKSEEDKKKLKQKARIEK